ncbi:MAG: LamG domain-containing protein, partial [Candidatus Latescibacteria bacterium]|nr:LamG domain-containing protein [Candidatus Latescibacterota bacterium]
DADKSIERVDNILLESFKVRRSNPPTDNTGLSNLTFPVIDFNKVSFSTIRDVSIILSPGISDTADRPVLADVTPGQVAVMYVPGIRLKGETGSLGSYYNRIQGCQIDGCYIGIDLVDYANGNIIDGGTILRCPIGIRLHGKVGGVEPMNANKIIGTGIEIATGNYADVAAIDGETLRHTPPLSDSVGNFDMPVGVLMDGYTRHNVLQGVRIENLWTCILEKTNPTIQVGNANPEGGNYDSNDVQMSKNADNYYLATHLVPHVMDIGPPLIVGTKYALISTPTVLDSGKSNIDTLLSGVSTKSDLTYPYLRTTVNKWVGGPPSNRAGRDVLHVEFKVGIGVPFGQPQSLLKAGFVVETDDSSNVWRTVAVDSVDERSTAYGNTWIVLNLVEEIGIGKRCRISYYLDHARAVFSDVGGVLVILASSPVPPTSSPISLSSFTHDIVIDAGLPSASATTPANTLLNGLEAYYRLEEATGERADSSGNGYNLDTPILLLGSVPPGNLPGQRGNGLALVIDEQGVSRNAGGEPAGLSATQHMSVSMWLKFNSVNTPDGVFTNQLGAAGSFRIDQSNDGKLKIWINPSTNYIRVDSPLMTVPDPSDPSPFTHVVAIYDGTKAANKDRVDVWVNGTRVTNNNKGYQGTIPTTCRAVGGRLIVGNIQNLTSPFDGIIDELAFWDRSLSDVDVAALWNGGAGTYYNDFE